MSKRNEKTYYIVWTMRDGTIVGVLETHKPLKNHSIAANRSISDVYRRYVTNAKIPVDLEPWLRGAYQTTISTRLNVKRPIREQVEPALVRVQQQLERIEQLLKRTCGR